VSIKNNSAIIAGDSLGRIIRDAFDHVNNHGQDVMRASGKYKICRGMTLVWNDPQEKKDRYPYWDEDSEHWYLENFVDEHTGPPEAENQEIILPFTYSWRSNYYDHGWGYVFHVAKLLRQLNYSEIPFTRAEDINELIKETYRAVHPDILMAVIAWIGKQTLEDFITQPDLATAILSFNRQNAVQNIVNKFSHSVLTNHAITPSMFYPATDYFSIFTHIPSFQSYQVLAVIDAKNSPIGFETFHVQRSMSAEGNGQLDFCHAAAWAKFIAENTGLPHIRTSIFINELYIKTEKQKVTPTNIKDLVIQATDGYEAAYLDINKRLESAEHVRKVDVILNLLNV
jgi:hypothetical protein